MDADSIVIGNAWKRFREYCHGSSFYMLSIFCRYANSKRILGYLVISSNYIVRDVICMPPKSLRKTKVT